MEYHDVPTGNERLEALAEELLVQLGEDPAREGLVKTPSRIASALSYLTKGYAEDPSEVIGDALFEAECQEIVLVRGIEFYSLCEHHMLPFIGTAHIGYIPDKHIVGLSKVARVVEVFSRRLQVQERLTQQIADCLLDHLKPLGVAVVMEANHLCMMMRGVEKQGSSTITSAMHGVFRNNLSTRSEFMGLIRGVT